MNYEEFIKSKKHLLGSFGFEHLVCTGYSKFKKAHVHLSFNLGRRCFSKDTKHSERLLTSAHLEQAWELSRLWPCN